MSSVSVSVVSTSRDRVVDVFGRVVRNARLHPDGQLGLDAGHRLADVPITSSELAVGSTQTPMNIAVSPLKRTSSS